MKEKITDKLKSRKFWAALAAGAVVAANMPLGLGLDEPTVQHLSYIAIAYIGGQGLVDAAKAFGLLKGGAQ